MSHTSKHDPAPRPRNVAQAIVIKSEDIFFLCRHDGGVPAGNQDGYGLYYHDCRYLDGYEMRLADTPPNALIASAERGSVAEFELTNEKLNSDRGDTIPEQTFGIKVQRVIDSKECAVHDALLIENYDIEDRDLAVSLTFQSRFEDVFVIRGINGRTSGKVREPSWEDDVLVLQYDGADGVTRRVEIHCDPKPSRTSKNGAQFALHVPAGKQTCINVSLRIIETKQNVGRTHRHTTNGTPVAHSIDDRSRDWLSSYAEIESDSAILDAVMRRSLLDLLALRSKFDGFQFTSAGLPWYGALFGRDSLIASMQTLAFGPHIAEQTIRLLAKHQGTKVDSWRDEEPGKILHELRRGELANLNEIAQTPYYGSVDSTPLFLILIGEHARWTGSLSIFQELKQNVGRALRWIDEFGDLGHNGYVSYDKKSSKGLGNQGWKDSGDSIVNSDGSLATPPIALVEEQGYVYKAKLLIAELYARTGDEKTASEVRKQAQELKERFNRDYWVAEKNFYAIALQKDNRPATVISSNPGQALWTGIIDQARAADVVNRLMAEDMFSGWGIRTLSTNERRSNLIGYHLGTVWPHDNSIIAAGMRNYGFDEEAVNVCHGIIQASRSFHHQRLPEVFAGFSQQEFHEPVRYPVACHPQAWAAGSVPFFLTSLLGLVPDAFNRRLHVVRPVLPRGVNHLQFKRIKVGNGSVDLQFKRAASGKVQVQVNNVRGDIKVELESVRSAA